MTLTIATPLRVEAWFTRRGIGGATVVRTGMGPRRAARTGTRLAGTADAVEAPRPLHAASS